VSDSEKTNVYLFIKSLMTTDAIVSPKMAGIYEMVPTVDLLLVSLSVTTTTLLGTASGKKQL